MKNFKPGGFKQASGGFGGRQKFSKGGDRMGNGGGKFGGGATHGFRGAERPSHGHKSEMFSAVCSTCGRDCEVPFEPSHDKPVYCSACFGKKSQDMSRQFQGDSRDDRSRSPKVSYQERPAFEKSEVKNNNNELAEVKRQLTSLEGKLNRVLDMLNAQVSEPIVVTPVATVQVATVSPKVTKAKVEKGIKKVTATAVVPKKVTKPVAPVTKKAVAKVPKAVKVAKVVKKAKK